MPDSLSQRIIEWGDKHIPRFMRWKFPQFYDFELMYKDGMVALKEGNFELASYFSSITTRINPKNPDAWAMHTRALGELGRLTEALHAALVEVQLKPSAMAYWDVAKVLELSHRYDAAIDFIKTAINLEPENQYATNMLYHLGRLSVKVKREDVRTEVESKLKAKMPLIDHTDIFVSGFAPWAIARASAYNR